ncbi:DUF427 domain-containing protein [Mycolicibacterium sp. XJ1819]
MTDAIEKWWSKYPGYRVDLAPIHGRVQVTHDGQVLAETDAAVRVEESNHVDQIYVPRSDVRWELLTPSDTHTVCPFKGEASYWHLNTVDPPLLDVAWAYPEPFDEVAGLADHVAFYPDRVLVELDDTWRGAEPGSGQRLRLPVWGDQSDLLRIIDATPQGDGRYLAPVLRDLYPEMPDRRGRFRNVVEGGQLLGTAIGAAWQELPDQRVTMATMNFIRAATFDEPLQVDVDVLRRGRTFSTSEVRITQGGVLRSAGMLLHDVGAEDVMRHVVPVPDVAGPEESEPLDFGVSGREMRVVDGAYRAPGDAVGPPEIYTWCRFRDSPSEPRLHTALAVQSLAHWTISASMRPHPGISEELAHVTLATGPMTVTVWLLDDLDVTEWLLYANPSPWAGRGLSQGEGRVFTQDGRLVATYGVQAMVRAMTVSPDAIGGPNRAM